MRKFLVVFVVLVMGLSAGAYIYYYKPFAPASSMETLLPGDTLGMVRICHLDKQIDQFKNGKLGKALLELDWQRLMTILEIPAPVQNQIRDRLKKVEESMNSPLFDSFLGQDTALAILDTEIDPALIEAGNVQGLLDAVVAIARPKHPAAIFDHLTSMFDTQLAKETEAYKEWEIVKLSMDPRAALYYALDGDLMIAGVSAVPVKRCLDQIGSVATSLAEFPYFKDHGRDLFVDGQTEGQMYVNMEKLLARIKVLVDQGTADDPSLAAFTAQMENFQGIESFHWVQYDDGSPVIQSKMLVGMDRDRLAPQVRRAVEISPSTNPTLTKAPDNALLYSWQNNFDLKNFWEQIAENPDITPEDLDKIKQSFLIYSGIDLETFIGLFGHQFGLLLKDVKQGPMFPIPVFALFFEIDKPDEMNILITETAAKFKVPLTPDTHNEVDIQQIKLPLGEDLSPAFTLSDGFLTLAVNRSLLEAMLDTTDSSCISTNPNFKALGDDLTGDTNQMFFVQTEDLIGKSKDLINWGLTMMAITKPEQVQKLSEIMTVGVFPILDGLTMVKAMGGHLRNSEDVVVSDMRMLMDRG